MFNMQYYDVALMLASKWWNKSSSIDWTDSILVIFIILYWSCVKHTSFYF